MGPQLAQALRDHFKSEQNALLAAQRSDVAALAQVPGVSQRRAADIVRQVHGQGTGDRFLATPAARRVHDEVVERILSFAATSHGRNRLRLLAPLATPEEASRHTAELMGHKAMAAGLDREQVRRLLRRIRTPVEPTPLFQPTRMVLCETDEGLQRLNRLNLQKWAAVGGLEDLEQAGGYDLVLFLYDDGRDLAGLENAIEIPQDAPPEAIAPESAIAWFSANHDSISAAAQLCGVLGRPGKAGEALALLGSAPLLQDLAAALRREVEAVRSLLDARLKQRLAAVSVTGTELVESLGRRLPASIQKTMGESLAEGRRMVQERTGCAFQPFVAGVPVGVDEEELGRMERTLRTRSRIEAFEALRRLAKGLAALRPAVEQEIAQWQAFDAPFALGCFAHHYDLHPARFGSGLSFAASIHLGLADRPGMQRIAYRLGDGENVALLTGANSGGKTTLLEHVAQLALMARMGLPVVGRDVEVPWVEELHYVTARRSLDAGAFEAFLRGFLPLAMGTARRLVLADEVESVTELEAAGRILGFFLDRIAGSGSLAVVVSHMAPQILAHCHAPVRIDGIEATGLDGDNRLVVDRMPRIGTLARSTPEFIVQRLAATARGPERELYQALLDTFRRGGAATAPAARPRGKNPKRAPVSATP